jgi:hypothetical protein
LHKHFAKVKAELEVDAEADATESAYFLLETEAMEGRSGSS